MKYVVTVPNVKSTPDPIIGYRGEYSGMLYIILKGLILRLDSNEGWVTVPPNMDTTGLTPIRMSEGYTIKGVVE